MMRIGALLLCWLATCTSATAATVTALVGGTVIDGYGGPPILNGVVLIDGERITAVGPRSAITVPADAQVISTEGMTVLPGLWDLDVRLAWLGHGDARRWQSTYLPLAERVVMPLSAKVLLEAGVTSARDTGAPLDAAISVRDRVAQRRINGPTLYVAGPVITKVPEPGAAGWQRGVSGEESARERVRQVAVAGADYVLLGDIDLWTDAELSAAINEARVRTLPVHVRVTRASEVDRGLALGVDGFIGVGAGAEPQWPAATLAALGTRSRQPGGGPYWSPSLSPVFNFEWLRQQPEPLDDPGLWSNLPPLVAADIRGSLVDFARVSGIDIPALRLPTLCSRLRELDAAGARLVIGSGAGAPAHLPTRATTQEIIAWVRECGIDPARAIRAATSEAAAVVRVQHESGSLAPGKYADVIAVRGDVVRQIERLEQVTLVIRRGQRVK